MYTEIERRTINRERMQETMQRAQRDFFPKLQQAPGFISFYLVADEANGINTAVVVWESQAQAEAFGSQSGVSSWQQTLDQLGHTRQSANHGETVVSLERPR